MGKIITPGDPGFYINRKRYVEISPSEVRVGVEGYFSGRALKDGVVMREFGVSTPVPNLITNGGLDALSGTLTFSRMHLGTGTTPPAVTDTALTTFGVNVAANDPGQSAGNSGAPDYYSWARGTWTSAVGGATGNWTEIGISNQNTNGNLRSHALILDNLGAPTTFTVLADEQFQGTYELRFYQSLSDHVENITISGVPYVVTTRAISVQNTPANSILTGGSPVSPSSGSGGSWYTGALAALTASAPGGSFVSGTPTRTVAAYTSGNFYRDITYRFGPGAAVGNLRTFETNGSNSGRHSWQNEYNPIIAKLTTEELIHGFRWSWARR